MRITRFSIPLLATLTALLLVAIFMAPGVAAKSADKEKGKDYSYSHKSKGKSSDHRRADYSDSRSPSGGHDKKEARSKGSKGSHSEGSSGSSESSGTYDNNPKGGPHNDKWQAQHDPDQDENGGVDQPGGTGGYNPQGWDGNNGSGNDPDCEDDNRGNVSGKCKPKSNNGATPVKPAKNDKPEKGESSSPGNGKGPKPCTGTDEEFPSQGNGPGGADNDNGNNVPGDSDTDTDAEVPGGDGSTPTDDTDTDAPATGGESGTPITDAGGTLNPGTEAINTVDQATSSNGSLAGAGSTPGLNFAGNASPFAQSDDSDNAGSVAGPQVNANGAQVPNSVNAGADANAGQSTFMLAGAQGAGVLALLMILSAGFAAGTALLLRKN